MADDPENLRSLTMSANYQGYEEDFDAFATSSVVAPPSKPTDRPDINGKARQTIAKLIKGIQAATGTNEATNDGQANAGYETLRSELRAAHEDNRHRFLAILRKHEIEAVSVAKSNYAYGSAKKHSSSMQVAPRGQLATSAVAMGVVFVKEDGKAKEQIEQLP
jgi:hypothetical protein